MANIDPSKFKDIFVQFLGQTFSSLIIVMFAAFYLADELTEKIALSMQEQFYLSIMVDANRAIEFDLDKQDEKMSKDPEDLKLADLGRLTAYCTGNFRQYYVPTLASDRRLKVVSQCARIEEMYVHSVVR